MRGGEGEQWREGQARAAGPNRRGEIEIGFSFFPFHFLKAFSKGI